ncbi:MAG: hypothetical protein E6J90_36990 [Deltaproteobacteria bacterium]|nr:MAG: hypothetical protein E6J90_36990 [Deltaproteobacteria bacterium]
MRSWFMAVLAVLAIGTMAPGVPRAAPAIGHSTIDRATTGTSSMEDVRYVVRCHRVRVWRDTPYGRQPARVRRCHRVWVG